MADNRIVLRLNERIAFEREFGVQYRGVPRARRQEWIRSILRAGLAAIEGAAEAVAPAGRAYAPTALAAVAPVAPAPAPAPVVAAPAPAPVARPVRPAAKAELSGFFGDLPKQGT